MVHTLGPTGVPLYMGTSGPKYYAYMCICISPSVLGVYSGFVCIPDLAPSRRDFAPGPNYPRSWPMY